VAHRPGKMGGGKTGGPVERTLGLGGGSAKGLEGGGGWFKKEQKNPKEMEEARSIVLKRGKYRGEGEGEKKWGGAT